MDKKNIWLILSILWMAIIFGFSMQVATASSNTSSYVLDTILSCLHIVVDKQDSIYQILIFIIRKGAHMMEYFILACLWKGYFYHHQYSNRIVMMIVVLYAISDEVHQMFVVGRSGSVIDIAYDSLGALIALGMIEAILWINRRYQMIKKRRIT